MSALRSLRSSLSSALLRRTDNSKAWVACRAYSASPEGQTAQQVAVVQGASRGLGLEFATQLASRPGTVVYATCRDPATATQLRERQERHGNIRIVRLDVHDEATIRDAAGLIQSEAGKADLVLNVAGLLHIPGAMSPEVSYERVTPENILLSFKTNAIGPMLVAKHMVPLLAKGGDREVGRPAVLASLSAKVGSISDNSLGGWYSYRGAKAALNQMMKTLSIEVARKKMNVACLLLHPGTCNTDMSEPFRRNVRPDKLFEADRAVRQLLEIVDGARLEDNGRFIAWDKSDLPW